MKIAYLEHKILVEKLTSAKLHNNLILLYQEFITKAGKK